MIQQTFCRIYAFSRYHSLYVAREIWKKRTVATDYVLCRANISLSSYHQISYLSSNVITSTDLLVTSQMLSLQQIYELVKAVFWRILAWLKPPPRPPLDLVNSPIHRLPPEILLLIVDILSLESGASLSLTCLSFHIRLGAQCLSALKDAEYSTRNKFFTSWKRTYCIASSVHIAISFTL